MVLLTYFPTFHTLIASTLFMIAPIILNTRQKPLLYCCVSDLLTYYTACLLNTSFRYSVSLSQNLQQLLSLFTLRLDNFRLRSIPTLEQRSEYFSVVVARSFLFTYYSGTRMIMRKVIDSLPDFS